MDTNCGASSPPSASMTTRSNASAIYFFKGENTAKSNGCKEAVIDAARKTSMILFRAAAWATRGCAWQGAQSKSSTSWACGSRGRSRCRKSFKIQTMSSTLFHEVCRRHNTTLRSPANSSTIGCAAVFVMWCSFSSKKTGKSSCALGQSDMNAIMEQHCRRSARLPRSSLSMKSRRSANGSTFTKARRPPCHKRIMVSSMFR